MLLLLLLLFSHFTLWVSFCGQLGFD